MQRTVTASQSKTGRPLPQCQVQLVTKKQVLGFKPTTRLEQVGDKHPEHTIDRKHRH